MADNVAITAGSGTTIAADDVGSGVLQQRVKITWGADGTGNDVNTTTPLPVQGSAATISTSKTRPNDTTAYAANDAWSDSTSAPTALTFTSVFRASGGTALITGLDVISSANKATALQGELWLFDTAPTAINDNAAFTITDGEYETVVAKIPFVLDSPGNSAADASGNTGCFIDGLGILVTGVSSANLTGLIKVINAYTPVAQEKLTFRLKAIRID